MSIERHERLLEQMAALQMLAFKWMDAHDKLKAGKPYDLPTPADLPDALTTMQDREATLMRVLRDARAAIASLDTEALGMGQVAFGEIGVDVYPIRDELLGNIDEALGTSGLDANSE